MVEMPRIVSPAKAKSWEAHAVKLYETFIKHANDIPVLSADNVATYYYEGTGQEYWDLTRDFPNLAPPWQIFWVEHRIPKLIHSDKTGDTDTSKLVPNGRVGWLFIASELENVTFTGDVPAGTKWVYSAELWLDYGLGRPVQGPHATWHACIDGEGRLLDRPWFQSWAAPGMNEVVQALGGWIHPSLLAVSFLHCKNVTLEQQVCPPKLAKRTREKHGYTPVTYSTLVIEPLKAILRKEGRSDTEGLAKALHICRGHFKDYRQGRGLFGKYKVLVWHDAVVRGTKHHEGEKPPARNINVKV